MNVTDEQPERPRSPTYEELLERVAHLEHEQQQAALVVGSQAMRASEERHRVVLQTTMDGFWLVDPEGRLLEVNDTYVRMSGYSVDELLSMRIPDLEATETADKTAAHIQKIITEGEDRFESRHRRKDGSVFHVEISVRAQPAEGGRIVCFLHDITERKKVQSTLLETMQRLQLATASGHLGVWDWDVQSNVMIWNDRMFELYGIDRESFPSTAAAWEGGLHPDDHDRAIEESQAALRGDKVFDTEFRVRHPNGTTKTLKADAIVLRDGAGKPLRMVGLNRDITDLKLAEEQIAEAHAVLEARVRERTAELDSANSALKAEIAERSRGQEALRESENRLSLALSSSSQGLWDWDIARDEVYLSPDYYRMHGYADGEVRGSFAFFQSLLHPDDAPMVVNRIKDHLQGKSLVSIVEYRARRKSGDYFWIRGVGRVTVRDDHGAPLRMLGVITDITEQKRAEEALRDADRHKDEFLAMLSHELRNPLAPIRNSLYVLDRAVPGSEQARRALKVVDRQVVHLTRLVDDLLDVTRISRGKIQLQRESLDLTDVVRRAVEDHREVFAKNSLDLQLSIPDERIRINGDGTRIAQIVGNLLGNAAKFTLPGGRVTVVVEANEPLRQAVVRVRDTGPGIAPEMLPQIFEPFTQADTTLDRSKGGLGLGLALVKGITEIHGGTASVESEGLGKGAEFTVRFPLAVGLTQATEPVRGTSRKDARRRRVLIIEDSVDAAESLSEVLELAGHTVEFALSGAEGIEKAGTFRPDMVVCDIGLPRMDGYEVAKRMRADPALKAIALVALTGYAGPEDVARARKAGFDHHMAKPLRIEKLEELLASLGSS